MQTKQQLINDFSELISFVESLRSVDEGKWSIPLGEGKWTPRDVIAHIMLWDKYFLEEAILKITTRQPLTSRHLDFDEFNKKAVEYAKGRSKQEILDETIYYRTELLRQLESISEEDFVKEFVDGDGKPFSAYYYVKGFIPHDVHHIRQLDAFFSNFKEN